MSNKGLIYETTVKNILTARNLLPSSLTSKLASTENDAGFVHDGKEFFLELKNKDAPDYGARQIDFDAATKKWKWNKTDAMTLVFDSIGILPKVNAFEPHKFVKSDDQLTDADKRSDRARFAKKLTEDETDLGSLGMTGAHVLHLYYEKKQCFYIQIEGKGFYYLLNNPAGLNVPQFLPQIVFRLRAKTHGSARVSNYSFRVVITAARGTFANSPFDLENPQKFPL